MRSDGERFAADSEEFGFHAVAHFWSARGQRCIEAVTQAFAGGDPIDRSVFVPVRNPDVIDGGRAEFFCEMGGDAAGTANVLNPELANGFVSVGERESIGGERMREQGGIEINSSQAISRPLNPRIKMLRLDRVTVDGLASKVAVGGVKIESVGTWNQAECFVEVRSEFIEGSGAARMIAGDGNPTGESASGGFKAGDIIALPALERDGDGGQRAKRGFCIDPE